MPIYEYSCIECDLNTTRVKSFSNSDQPEFCSTCGNVLNRVYSSVGVTFNGSGFYSTDK